MGRRIRPKTRPKPADQDASEKGGSKKRIKIRMGRATSDPFHAALLQAKAKAEKEAKVLIKAAGGKGYKSGVTKQKKLEKKKRDELNAALDRSEDREQMLKDRLTRVDICLSLLCEENEDHIVLLNSKGLRMGCFGPPQNESYKLLWDQGAATMSGTANENGSVEYETEEAETDITSSKRHRLHPGHKIAIQDMWDIWAAAGRNKKDVDPMQGMRGAWYWNERRYSSKSSAMNAWRRHMRSKRVEVEENTVVQTRVERDENGVDRSVAEVDSENAVFTAEDPDDDDFDESPLPFMAEHDFDEGDLRHGRNIRNRLNRFFRNHEEPSLSWWMRHRDTNIETIEQAQAVDGLRTSPFMRVLMSFTVPVEHWDDDNWEAFRQSYNHYLEVKTNRGARVAGEPTRRRRGRRATRGSTNRGYNRSNY